MKRKYIYSYDALRALACLSIFMGHTGIYRGGVIVTFFIVLAGFTCNYTFTNNITIQWNTGGKYLIYRISKIWVPHMAAFLCTIPWLIYLHYNDWMNMLSYHLFIQSYIPKLGYYFAINGVEWTISAFIGAWFLAPYINQFIEKMNDKLIVITISIIVVIIGMIPFYFDHLQGESGWWATSMNPVLFVIPEFCIGMLLSQFLKRRVHLWKPEWKNIIEILAFFLILFAGIRMNESIENSNIKLLIFSIIIIFAFYDDDGWISKHIFHKKIFKIVSDISMEIYFLHYPLLTILNQMLHLDARLSAVLALCIVFPTAKLVHEMNKICLASIGNKINWKWVAEK